MYCDCVEVKIKTTLDRTQLCSPMSAVSTYDFSLAKILSREDLLQKFQLVFSPRSLIISMPEAALGRTPSSFLEEIYVLNT